MDGAAKQSGVIKISHCEMDGNVSSCHPKSGAWMPSPRRETSQSPPVKNDRQRDKTNYVDGDMWLTGCRVDQTDRDMGTGGRNHTDHHVNVDG